MIILLYYATSVVQIKHGVKSNEIYKLIRCIKDKGKGFPYSLPSVGPGADLGVQAVSPQVTISHPLGSRLLLLSAKPAVTFPAVEHHCFLASTKVYFLVTEAHRCEQLVQRCYSAFAPSRISTHDLLIASPMLYPLRQIKMPFHYAQNYFVLHV